MGDLSFTLLGPLEVRHADQVLLFSTRKELALLIYLVVEGRIHWRKNLSEQFWTAGDGELRPEPPGDSARAVVLRCGESTGTALCGVTGCAIRAVTCSPDRDEARTRCSHSSNAASMTILCSLITIF